MVPKDYQEKLPPNHLQLNFSGWDLDMVLYNQDTVLEVKSSLKSHQVSKQNCGPIRKIVFIFQ